ncbi:hypothetical protein PM082_020127 [Marasmius tenuissimus]|nr:hypothetical protein PM082_020127 [Marasmius tenuissimus]
MNSSSQRFRWSAISKEDGRNLEKRETIGAQALKKRVIDYLCCDGHQNEILQGSRFWTLLVSTRAGLVAADSWSTA